MTECDAEKDMLDTVIFALGFSIIVGLFVYILALPSNLQERASEICADKDGVELIDKHNGRFVCNNGESFIEVPLGE